MQEYLKQLVNKGFDDKCIISCMNYKFPHNFEVMNGAVYINDGSKWFKIGGCSGD